MKKHSDIRTPLAKVRGLGSAHDGTGHFIAQRVTAIAMVPLIMWFVFSVLSLAVNGDHERIAAWMGSGMHATLVVLLLIAVFYHAKLGVQVVIEDYVHCACIKIAALLANAFFMYGLAALGIMAVLKLHLHL